MLETATQPALLRKSPFERFLSIFADVRPGEGLTAVLMLLNISLLLVCYSIIKTVREPLILLGGGAEVRSYAAGGQALLLMGFVPLYSWFAGRVNRRQMLVGVSLFFLLCIELFAAAVSARVPYVGLAFFVWVGIFNISLVAQFWSFANDLYTKEAGDRLFPIIVIGMTAGAPLGSFVAARLFHSGVTPQVILQVSAALLAVSVVLYLWINRREDERQPAARERLSSAGGFRLVLASPYLRLVALLIVLLNVVNTTGEYLIARLLTAHVRELALASSSFDKQAYIGAFSGTYQFWVNVSAFGLQAFAASRLVKYSGLRGILLALPLIALGGYAIVAAGVGFSVVRWIKTGENATDYSIMNTARQMLWLPTSRDEKYKAKQAIDTFFVRGGDVLSALGVYVGAGVLHLSVQQFALGNIVLTIAWLVVACAILAPKRMTRPAVLRPALVIAGLALVVVLTPVFATAQETRGDRLAAAQAEKASQLRPYEPDKLERRIERVDDTLALMSGRIYPFVGSTFDGGGLAVGPGIRARFGGAGTFGAHAGWSFKNYKTADASFTLPAFAHGRMTLEMRANWLHAPDVSFYGTGNTSRSDNRAGFSYRTTTVGISTRVQATRLFAVGAGLDAIHANVEPAGSGSAVAALNPTYRRTRFFAEIDSRSSKDYTRRGGLYRVEWADYRQTGGGPYSFQRTDAEVRQFVPIFRENWIIALRALASTTSTASGQVPYFLMPDLGGSHWLRGYPAWRFRDRNRLLLSGEYRWTAGPFVDMAAFIDAGKVASRASDLDASNLKKTYGVGITLHTLTTTVTRIELARTPDGNSLVFSFSPSF